MNYLTGAVWRFVTAYAGLQAGIAYFGASDEAEEWLGNNRILAGGILCVYLAVDIFYFGIAGEARSAAAKAKQARDQEKKNGS